jgi:hypothetical protein
MSGIEKLEKITAFVVALTGLISVVVTLIHLWK